MKQKYSTPYIVRFPVGDELYDEYLRLIRKGKTSVLGISQEFTDMVAFDREQGGFSNILRSGSIFADAVVAGSIGNYLESHGVQLKYFTISGEDRFAQYLKDEDEILEKVEGEDDLLIGDPLFLEHKRHAKTTIDLPHYAVSSRVGKDKNFNYLDTRKWLDLIS